MANLNVVIPHVPEKLRPEVRELGEKIGARFVGMPGSTSDWELFEESWADEGDFISIEQDVLATEEMIREMWACSEPWCSGTYGCWWWEELCAPTEGPKWCGEAPWPRCGTTTVTHEKLARVTACRQLHGRTVLRSDGCLALVKFGSIRRQFPDLLARAARHHPTRHWRELDRAMWRVMYDEELLSPHLHFPPVAHLKPAGPNYDDPWDKKRYERDRQGWQLGQQTPGR